MPLRCVLLAVLLCASGAAQPELVREWEKILGPPGAAPWLTAVCPNGMFYAADGRGSAVAVGGDGKIRAQSGYVAALFRARALACDGDGLLYAARAASLAVLRVSAGGFEVVRDARVEVSISAMTVGARGRIYAAGRRPGSRLPLHVLEPDGRLIRSFGERPTGPIYPSFEPQPFLLWQKRPERLLVVSPATYQVEAYAPDGALLQVVRPRGRAGIHPVQFFSGGITGAAVLRHGRVAVQHGSYGPDTFLDLLDVKLRIAGNIPAFPGKLAGASSSGQLYFFDTNRRASLTKASLNGGSAATRVLAWNYEVFRVVFCCPVRNHRAGSRKVPG